MAAKDISTEVLQNPELYGLRRSHRAAAHQQNYFNGQRFFFFFLRNNVAAVLDASRIAEVNQPIHIEKQLSLL